MTLKVTLEEQSTVDSYNKNAKAWSKGHMDQDFWQKERELFKENLPTGKVLEIGCGGGRDAQKLISLGYYYTGTDASEGFLDVARENNPGVLFLPKSVYNLDFPEDTFDGFWASAVLLHIPKNRIDEAFQNIKKVIKPNGIGFLSMKQGDREIFIEEDRGEEGIMKRLFVFYSQDELNKVIKRNGFEIVYSDIHPPDGKTIWLTYILKVTK